MKGHSVVNLGSFELTTRQKRILIERIEHALIFNDSIVIKIRKRKNCNNCNFAEMGEERGGATR